MPAAGSVVVVSVLGKFSAAAALWATAIAIRPGAQAARRAAGSTSGARELTRDYLRLSAAEATFVTFEFRGEINGAASPHAGTPAYGEVWASVDLPDTEDDVVGAAAAIAAWEQPNSP